MYNKLLENLLFVYIIVLFVLCFTQYSILTIPLLVIFMFIGPGLQIIHDMPNS